MTQPTSDATIVATDASEAEVIARQLIDSITHRSNRIMRRIDPNNVHPIVANALADMYTSEDVQTMLDLAKECAKAKKKDAKK